MSACTVKIRYSILGKVTCLSLRQCGKTRVVTRMTSFSASMQKKKKKKERMKNPKWMMPLNGMQKMECERQEQDHASSCSTKHFLLLPAPPSPPCTSHPCRFPPTFVSRTSISCVYVAPVTHHPAGFAHVCAEQDF